MRLVVVCVVALLVVGCGAQERPAEPRGPLEVEVTGSASGASTSLVVGDVLVIELESNETTGYQWSFVEADPAVLTAPDGQEYTPPSEAMPGAPGTSVWRFTAKAAGQTTVKLAYARPFEPDAKPAETFTLTVLVED